VGSIFRADGISLRDDYQISGKELETMCDIVRTIPGVLGERMLGGGDKGASGALILPEAEEALRNAVATAYTRSHPDFADSYAVHSCRMVDGITLLPGWE
jgi:galactokinase